MRLMRKVYTSDNSAIIGHARQVLENHAIPCVVRNDFLLGGAGELPVNETWAGALGRGRPGLRPGPYPRRRDRGGGAGMWTAVALRVVRRADGGASSRIAGAAGASRPDTEG